MENNTQTYNRYSYALNNPLLPPLGAGGYTDPTGWIRSTKNYIPILEDFRPGRGGGGGGMSSVGQFQWMSTFANFTSMYGFSGAMNAYSSGIVSSVGLQNFLYKVSQREKEREASENHYITMHNEDGVYSNDPYQIKRMLKFSNRGWNTDQITDFYNESGIIIYGINGNFTVDQNSFWNTWNTIQADLNNLETNYQFDHEMADMLLTVGGTQNDLVNFTANYVVKTTKSVHASEIAALAKTAKFAKITSSIGFGLTAASAVNEYYSGNFNTHTLIDIGITGVLIGAGFIFTSPAAIIGLAGVGLVYGIGSALGSDWIDNKTNDWGKNLIYKK